jgi:hypothetical protein
MSSRDDQYDDFFFAQFDGASYGAARGPVLKAGGNNPVDMVKAWSNDLNSLNNPRYTNVAYVLGRWTPRLTEATRNFQTDQRIGIDGKAGDGSRKAMVAAKAASAASMVAAGAAAASTPGGGFFSSLFDASPALTVPINASVADTSEADVAALAGAQAEAQATVQASGAAPPVPFLQQETWTGGPTMGKTLTIGGLVLGGLGLIVTLVKSLRPAPGRANRRRT